MVIVSKMMSRIERACILKMNSINVKVYMKMYNAWLRRQSLNIACYDGVGYIDPSAYLDGSDYSRITIGRNVTISKEVVILTHDYSIWNAMIAIDGKQEKTRYEFLKEVKIGENCFIGARSVILPGTVIEDNVIIGAASVVKGNLSNNTVWAGNPARKICSIEEFARKHIDLRDFKQV